MAKLIGGIVLLCCSMALCAQQTTDSAVQDTAAQVENELTEGFELLKDLPTKNQIPLFDNRFRVDDNVKEITLLMFRRRGSASVVLVQPDGSKLYFNRAEKNNIRWHDASSYDLIEIKNPMPGPWQAVGRIVAGADALPAQQESGGRRCACPDRRHCPARGQLDRNAPCPCPDRLQHPRRLSAGPQARRCRCRGGGAAPRLDGGECHGPWQGWPRIAAV